MTTPNLLASYPSLDDVPAGYRELYDDQGRLAVRGAVPQAEVDALAEEIRAERLAHRRTKDEFEAAVARVRPPRDGESRDAWRQRVWRCFR